MSAREALIEDLNASHAKLRDIARRYSVDWQPPADA